MPDRDNESLVTHMKPETLFEEGERVPRPIHPGVLVTHMSVDKFVGTKPIDPSEVARVLYEIASEG